MYPTFIGKYKLERREKVSMKNKNVRLFGLMAVLTALLSVSVIGCKSCPCGIPDPAGTVSGTVKGDSNLNGYDTNDPDTSSRTLEPGGVVVGTVRDDSDMNGYDANDPVIPGPSMRLLLGSNVFAGPISRTPEGMYTFSAPTGTYTLEASASGFITKTQSVTITAGGYVTKNFGLRHP